MTICNAGLWWNSNFRPQKSTTQIQLSLAILCYNKYSTSVCFDRKPQSNVDRVIENRHSFLPLCRPARQYIVHAFQRIKNEFIGGVHIENPFSSLSWNFLHVFLDMADLTLIKTIGHIFVICSHHASQPIMLNQALGKP